MQIRLHEKATTPNIMAAIQAGAEPERVLTQVALGFYHFVPEFWISSCCVWNAPNDVWDDTFPILIFGCART